MSCVVVGCEFGSDLLSGIAIRVVPELLSVVDFELLMADDMVVSAEIDKTKIKSLGELKIEE
jgi:hypothetical protein